jgi:hypothetical protein
VVWGDLPLQVLRQFSDPNFRGLVEQSPRRRRLNLGVQKSCYPHSFEKVCDRIHLPPIWTFGQINWMPSQFPSSVRDIYSTEVDIKRC